MQTYEILNDLLSTPYNELSTIELDIRLLNEFEVGTLIGGGTNYFSSTSGDNMEKFTESCSRHSFTDLLDWIKRAEDINPELISVNRDTRCLALVKLSEADEYELSEQGSQLAEKAGTLCTDLVFNNSSELETACLARR